MPTKLAAGQSQLDWLWAQYGNRAVTNDPTGAQGTDVLDKNGVGIIITNMISKLVRKLELVDDENNPDMQNVMYVTNAGEKLIAFQIEKEDYLTGVVLRMSTQADVDAGKIGYGNKLVLEFKFKRGNTFLVDMSKIAYEGSESEAIRTVVTDDGVIEAYLKLANSTSKGIQYELTKNGLLINLIINKAPGQVVLEETDCGLVAKMDWADGTPVRLRMLTWAEYQQLLNGDVDGDCTCGCVDGSTCQENDCDKCKLLGCIYYITDKGYFYLNGEPYGRYYAVGTDSIAVHRDGKTKNWDYSVKVSAKPGNMVEVKDDGLFSLFMWAGSNSDKPFKVWYELEEKYQTLTEDEKKQSLFFCSDSKKVYIQGQDMSTVSDYKAADDAIRKDVDAAFQQLTTYVGQVDSRVNTAAGKATEALAKIEALELKETQDIDRLEKGITENAEDIAQLQTDTKNIQSNLETVNNNLVESINTINKNMADGFNTINGGLDNGIRPELARAVKYEDAGDEDNPERKKVVILNDTPFYGTDTEGNVSTIFNLSKANILDLGSIAKETNINGKGERPTYNGTEELALFKDIEDLHVPVKVSVPLRTLKDEVYSKEDLLGWFGVETEAELKELIVKEANFYVEYGIILSYKPMNYKMPVQYVAFESDTQIKMVFVGLDTNNDKPCVYTILMNLDGTVISGNCNVSIEMVNILQPEDIKDMVSYTDVATGDNPGRKAIILKNHDVILGTATNGTTYALVMLSKWDKADFGSASVLLNLNGSAERPTYNDKEDLALKKDVDAVEIRLNTTNGVIATVQQSVATNQSNIADIQTTVNDIQSDVTTIGGELREKLIDLEEKTAHFRDAGYDTNPNRRALMIANDDLYAAMSTGGAIIPIAYVNNGNIVVIGDPANDTAIYGKTVTINGEEAGLKKDIDAVADNLASVSNTLESLRATVVNANLELMKSTLESLRATVQELQSRVEALESKG